MIRLKHKSTKRIVTAICLLLTFTFMSLYATYQNGYDFNAAYAQNSQGNGSQTNGSGWDCAAAIAACVGLTAAAVAACSSGIFSWGCLAATGAAAAACLKIPSKCN